MPASPRPPHCPLLLAILLCTALSPFARALGPKGDVYLGYSRLGSNAFYPGVGGLNGWQGAMQVKLKKPFLGVEADVAQFGIGAPSATPRTTSVMGGPRITVGTLGVKVFAHVLVGVEHSANSATPRISGTAIDYALGAGVDFRIAPFFAWRVGGDYLAATTQAPSSATHFRLTTGIAFRF